MQFRVIVVTDPQTQSHTHRQDRLQYTAPELVRSVLTKNEKPLNRVNPVQYSPRRQSRWVLADYGGKDLWKR